MAIRLRYLADLNPSKGKLKGMPTDTEVSFLPMEAIGERGELDVSQKRTLGEASSGYTFIRDGDVVIAKITPCFENGKGAYISGLVNGIGFGTTELIVVRPKGSLVNPRFLSYVFQSPHFRKPAEGHMTGAGGQKRVPDDFVRDFLIEVTDDALQDKIVRFLDRETAEIDALIEKQERLIALLEEKRQAAISHAVTKGLDPNAPMKDSGIPYLGEIPKHWSICKVKHLFALKNGNAIDSDSIFPEGEYPVYGGNGLRGYTDDFTHAGDRILIGRQGALCGNVHAAHGRFWATEHAIVATPVRQINLEYFTSVFTAMNLGQYSVAAAQPGLAGELVGNLGVPLPSLVEQSHVADKIGHDVQSFALATRNCLQSNRLLQERRSALISAAVTGKIDLTGRI